MKNEVDNNSYLWLPQAISRDCFSSFNIRMVKKAAIGMMDDTGMKSRPNREWMDDVRIGTRRIWIGSAYWQRTDSRNILRRVIDSNSYWQ